MAERGEYCVENRLAGIGARADDMQVFIAKGDESLRLDSRLVHEAEKTSGDILIKGIVSDRAFADIGGMIKIEESGPGAASFLKEQAMLLGPFARARANPALEIKNNDVSSRHSASVARIGEEKIFYLMSRGLSREEAKGAIVEGFIDSAFAKVGDPEVQAILRKAVLERL